MRNLLKRTFLSVLSALLFLQLWGCSTKEFAETFSRIENRRKRRRFPWRKISASIMLTVHWMRRQELYMTKF